MIRVRSAFPQDAADLAGRLRAADLREMKAASGEQPLTILERGITFSDPCLAIIDQKDLLLALFGVVPDPRARQVGQVWLMASDNLVEHSTSFLRQSREWVGRLQQDYRVLWNTVDARNTVHIRWLTWCGFHITAKIEEFGPSELPFYEFELTRGR
jgi:hypothetical protein